MSKNALKISPMGNLDRRQHSSTITPANRSDLNLTERIQKFQNFTYDDNTNK